MDAKHSKTLGLLGGFLIGDAMGAPFNGIKAGHIQQVADGRVDGFIASDKPILFPEKPSQNRYPGLHTAHGQALLAVVAGSVDDQSGQHPVSRTAARLKDLAGDGDAAHHTLGALRGLGKPLMRSLARWNAEYPWEPQDHFAPSEVSEGASPCAMAVACAAVEGGDPIEYARLTHTKEASLVAAWTIWKAARLLLAEENPKKPDAAGIVRQLHEGARALEDELRQGDIAGTWQALGWGRTPVKRFSDCLEPLKTMLELNDDNVAEKTIINTAGDYSPDRNVTHVQHGFAAALVPWVLYRALGPMNPAHAIEDAVNRGGETSLAAGLIGALQGARWGNEHLPDEWTGGCHGYRTAQFFLDNISENAVEAWLADERRWTDLEQSMQAPIRNQFDKAKASSPPKKKKPKSSGPDPHIHSFTTQEERHQAEVAAALEDEDLDPREKKRLKTERGKKRISWKDQRGIKPRDGFDEE
ncbi:MAG: ADP-ribosylglycohydrolase family protein [Sumerlaeia bacterium]